MSCDLRCAVLCCWTTRVYLSSFGHSHLSSDLCSRAASPAHVRLPSSPHAGVTLASLSPIPSSPTWPLRPPHHTLSAVDVTSASPPAAQQITTATCGRASNDSRRQGSPTLSPLLPPTLAPPLSPARTLRLSLVSPPPSSLLSAVLHPLLRPRDGCAVAPRHRRLPDRRQLPAFSTLHRLPRPPRARRGALLPCRPFHPRPHPHTSRPPRR